MWKCLYAMCRRLSLILQRCRKGNDIFMIYILNSGSAVKNLPVVPEKWVPSLGQEDPLQEEMATHSSIFD